MAVRVQEAASLRLDEIYRYTRDRWGIEQADRYITDLFAAFDRIESHGVASRPVPAEFGVEGFYFCLEHHFVYWRRLSIAQPIDPRTERAASEGARMTCFPPNPPSHFLPTWAAKSKGVPRCKCGTQCL